MPVDRVICSWLLTISPPRFRPARTGSTMALEDTPGGGHSKTYFFGAHSKDVLLPDKMAPLAAHARFESERSWPCVTRAATTHANPSAHTQPVLTTQHCQ